MEANGMCLSPQELTSGHHSQPVETSPHHCNVTLVWPIYCILTIYFTKSLLISILLHQKFCGVFLLHPNPSYKPSLSLNRLIQRQGSRLPFQRCSICFLARTLTILTSCYLAKFDCWDGSDLLSLSCPKHVWGPPSFLSNGYPKLLIWI
jgi:hypothetical protein